MPEFSMAQWQVMKLLADAMQQRPAHPVCGKNWLVMSGQESGHRIIERTIDTLEKRGFIIAVVDNLFYRLAFSGGEAIHRENVFPGCDEYKAYRLACLLSRQKALSYEAWEVSAETQKEESHETE